MKKIIIQILLLLPFIGYSQGSFSKQCDKAITFYNNNQIDSAYVNFKALESSVAKTDTLYDYALWYYAMSARSLESENRGKEKFDKALEYGLEAFALFEKGKDRYDEYFAERMYYAMKNIIISHYGLGHFDEGKKWKERLYKAYKKGVLPEGIENYFNYDYFTLGDKNVWGYEWFADLPENRYSSSFTKVVYYVYDTNSDGTDKNQLYRLHVLMFHGDNENFDYVMDKKINTAEGEVGGTLYKYTYKEDIDFEKLKNDVKEIVKGELETDTKRTSKKGKDGKTSVDVEIK